MSFSARKRRHSISGAFVFLLLGVFAVMSTVLVLFGAQAYRNIVDRTAVHNQTRILQSFVRNAVLAEDVAGALAVDEVDGLPVLTVTDASIGYVKYIYVYDGALRELFIAESREFEPEQGEVICAAASMTPVLSDGLLTVELTDENGNGSTMTLALRCAT